MLRKPDADSSGPVRPRVLVVDDEPMNLDLLERSLHRRYQVLKAGNGPELLPKSPNPTASSTPRTNGGITS